MACFLFSWVEGVEDTGLGASLDQGPGGTMKGRRVSAGPVVSNRVGCMRRSLFFEK